MCGIAGLIVCGTPAEDVAEPVRKMTAALRHRGPDDAGVCVVANTDPAVALGHRRLSIIDVTSAGHQPMRDDQSGVTITYNGEIYNFRELKRELETRGHRFTTGTDTEVIIRGYIEWDYAVFARLRGIFALALWDPRVRALLLARDPLGVKPLYVYTHGRVTAFASEVRALVDSQIGPRTLDLDGVRSYLAFGSVQEPLTLVRNVRSLDPGTVAIVKANGTRKERYYSLPSPVASENGAAPIALREMLVDAVGSQLVSDVPLGAFLSGGIDSSAIAILMRRAGSSDVRTFNVCFRNGGPLDERRFARLAATAASANHTDIEMGDEEFLANLDPALAAYDQPSVDGVNTWFVSRAVRDAGLTVALAGVGGDELFVGYNRFAKAVRAERVGGIARRVPKRMRWLLGHALEAHGNGESLRQSGMLLTSTLEPYFSTRRLFGPLRADALLRDAYRDAGREDWTDLRLRPLGDAVAGVETINKVSWLELQSYMLSTLLRDTDQMSMAHALEVRVPLIDPLLIDAVLPMRGEDKVSPLVPKRLLVEALDDAIPSECVHRRKRGFTLPFDVWLRSPRGSRAVDERLVSGSVEPLDRAAVARARRDFESRRISWSRVWALFVLADWVERHRMTV